MAFIFGFIVLLNLFQNMWYLNIISEFLSKPRVLLLLFVTQGIADVELSRDLHPVLFIELERELENSLFDTNISSFALK